MQQFSRYAADYHMTIVTTYHYHSWGFNDKKKSLFFIEQTMCDVADAHNIA